VATYLNSWLALLHSKQVSTLSLVQISSHRLLTLLFSPPSIKGCAPTLMTDRNFSSLRWYALFVDITSAYINQSILIRFTFNLASSVKDRWHGLSGIVKMSHHTSDPTLLVIDMDSEGDVLLIVGKKVPSH